MVRLRFVSTAVITVLVASGLILAAACALRTPDGDRVLAAAAGEVVTEEAFRREYTRFILSSGVPDDLRLRQAMLHEMIGSRLMIKEALEGGIDQTPAFAHRRDVAARKLLVEAYVDHVVLDTLTVAEAEVREMFVRAQTQVTARHLYARTEAQAQALHARLLAGEAFEALAREVFRDTVLSANGGLLPLFTFDEMDAAFEDAAFSLPLGAVSGPVKTAQGYSIIRVEDRFTKPLITEQEFAEKRPRFEAYVLDRKRERARSALVRRIASDNAVTMLEPGTQALLNQITGAHVVSGGEHQDAFLAMPLLRFGPQGSVWTVAGFRERAGYASQRQRAQVQTREDLEAFAAGLVVNEQMAVRAVGLGLDRTGPYAAALQSAMDTYILQQVRQALDATVQVPEDSARAYYNEAPPGEFMHEAAVEVAALVFAVLSDARANRHHEAFGSSRTVFYNRRELGVWAEPVFAAQAGAILGPYESAQGFIILQVGRRREPAPKTYGESRGEIMAALRSQGMRRARRAAYADLEKRYEITIHAERLFSLLLL